MKLQCLFRLFPFYCASFWGVLFASLFTLSTPTETESISKFNPLLPINENDNWIRFTQFQQRFSKTYESLEELKHRFQIFSDNVWHITVHNQDSQRNFSMSINQFADLTQSEFQTLYVGSYGCKPFIV